MLKLIRKYLHGSVMYQILDPWPLLGYFAITRLLSTQSVEWLLTTALVRVGVHQKRLRQKLTMVLKT